MNRDKILLAIVIIMFTASAWVLWDNYRAQPALPVQSDDVSEQASSQARVRALQSNIRRGLNEFQPEGLWQELAADEQYQSLSREALVDIEIGAYGRPNPFIPVDYSLEAAPPAG